jgi:hypothetical protein
VQQFSALALCCPWSRGSGLDQWIPVRFVRPHSGARVGKCFGEVPDSLPIAAAQSAKRGRMIGDTRSEHRSILQVPFSIPPVREVSGALEYERPEFVGDADLVCTHDAGVEGIHHDSLQRLGAAFDRKHRLAAQQLLGPRRHVVGHHYVDPLDAARRRPFIAIVRAAIATGVSWLAELIAETRDLLVGLGSRGRVVNTRASSNTLGQGGAIHPTRG